MELFGTLIPLLLIIPLSGEVPHTIHSTNLVDDTIGIPPKSPTSKAC
jgi:hypothetical protein